MFRENQVIDNIGGSMVISRESKVSNNWNMSIWNRTANGLRPVFLYYIIYVPSRQHSQDY
jgi:hypothetical protein